MWLRRTEVEPHDNARLGSGCESALNFLKDAAVVPHRRVHVSIADELFMHREAGAEGERLVARLDLTGLNESPGPYRLTGSK